MYVNAAKHKHRLCTVGGRRGGRGGVAVAAATAAAIQARINSF